MLFLADYTGLEGREVGGIYRRQNSGHPLFSVRDRPRRKSCCQHQALKIKYLRHIRGCSSPGRAIRSQRIGSQFESDHLHQQTDRYFCLSVCFLKIVKYTLCVGLGIVYLITYSRKCKYWFVIIYSTCKNCYNMI